MSMVSWTDSTQTGHGRMTASATALPLSAFPMSLFLASTVLASMMLGTSASASSSVLHSENFAGCGNGGYAMSGLWHPATLSACTPGQPGCGLYCGLDATCDFSAGTVSGSATSPIIDLSDYVAPVMLRFDYRIQTELTDRPASACEWDVATVSVSDDGFATSTVVVDQGCGAPTMLIENAPWQTATVDLSAWAGSTVQLRFDFNSGDGAFNDYFGFAVTNIEVEATDPIPMLTLEGIDCQDDAHPAPGHQIAVGLWMRDVVPPGATGFQAFVEFDDSLLGYRDDLSAYTPLPFPQHIFNFNIGTIDWAPGKLRLDGSVPFGVPVGSVGDQQLAVLYFDVDGLAECGTTDLGFGGYPAVPYFISELSLNGVPLPTILTATASLRLDDTAPSLSCPTDLTVAADISIPTPICAASNCCTAHGGIGCSDPACTATVCGFDPFCCDVAWDSICAAEAADSCGPVLVQNPCVGAVVAYTVTALDNCDPNPSLVCVPPSGSLFPIGTTPVTCSVIDDCGNTNSCAFNVTVTPTNRVLFDLGILVGTETTPSPTPVTRCIHFELDCSATFDWSLQFITNPFGVQTTGAFFAELPCGDWSTLCVKDEQHTKWSTVGLIEDPLGGQYWVQDAPVMLLPGDDDNDGDVDINDVTWLIFTYGSAAAPNPCPFDWPGPGPRDADFSLNGVVAAEDYSLMTEQFLTFSSCICTLPSEGGPDHRFDQRRELPVGEIDPRIGIHIDLNHDGHFSADDVLIFETQRGFAPVLSTKMRGEEPRNVRPSRGAVR
jgi:HYR domain